MKKDEFDPLYYNVCPECGLTATSVTDTETNVRKGWYCEHCTHFNPAIGRETIWRNTNGE
jgi:transposase